MIIHLVKENATEKWSNLLKIDASVKNTYLKLLDWTK